jgi:hypothetical protein
LNAGATDTADRLTSSAHLGATLRSVLIAPTAGFEAARRLIKKRTRANSHPVEGYTPYVLSFAGGAAMFVLWLKLSALFELRDVAPAEFRWGFLVAGGIGAGLLTLTAQFLWGWLAPAVSRGRDGAAGSFRLIWGAAAFPQLLALALLLPADILIVGPEAFTSGRPADSVSSAWAALSIALGVVLAVWSAVLMVKGARVVAGASRGRAIGACALAGLCLGVIVTGVRFAAVALVGS